jgi:hypothetical protein
MDKEDLRKVYEYQVYMTVFADTKAGGFILLFTGVVSAVIGSNKLNYATAVLSGRFALSNIIALLAFLALLISLGLLIWTIMPRRVPGQERDTNVIFWRHIARHSTSGDYIKRVRSLDSNTWADQWAEQIHSVASVASMKYTRLRDAVWVGLFGSLLMVWLFAIT